MSLSLCLTPTTTYGIVMGMKPTKMNQLKPGDYAIQHWTEYNKINLVKVVETPANLSTDDWWKAQTFVVDVESKNNGDSYHIQNTRDCHYYKVTHD